MLVFTLVLCMVAQGALAQRYMTVENTRGLNRFRFYSGDLLELKLEGDNFFYETSIIAIGNDSLVLKVEVGDQQRLTVGFSQVEAVRINKTNGNASLRALFGEGLKLAGIVTPLLRVVNNSFRVSALTTPVIATSVGLITAGVLLKSINHRKLKVGAGRKWELRVLDTGLAPPGRR